MLDNKKRFGKDGDLDKVMQTILLAENNGGGTMVAFEGENWKGVERVSNKTFWLREFLLGFAPLSTIR